MTPLTTNMLLGELPGPCTKLNKVIDYVAKDTSPPADLLLCLKPEDCIAIVLMRPSKGDGKLYWGLLFMRDYRIWTYCRKSKPTVAPLTKSVWLSFATRVRYSLKALHGETVQQHLRDWEIADLEGLAQELL